MIEFLDIKQAFLSDQLREAKWYEFADTITLYHGTSYAFKDNIQKEGLKPPSQELNAEIEDLMDRYMQDVPENKYRKIRSKLLRYIMSHVGTVRTDDSFNKVRHVIYFSTNKNDAEIYAGHYCETGGEIFSDVLEACNVFLNDLYMSEATPIYNDYGPIVVTVEVPFSWAITYRDLKSTYKKEKSLWASEQEWREEKRSFEEFLGAAKGGMEVRVDRPIPREMITNIEEVE